MGGLLCRLCPGCCSRIPQTEAAKQSCRGKVTRAVSGTLPARMPVMLPMLCCLAKDRGNDYLFLLFLPRDVFKLLTPFSQ